jgi:hypothetical protein
MSITEFWIKKAYLLKFPLAFCSSKHVSEVESLQKAKAL